MMQIQLSEPAVALGEKLSGILLWDDLHKHLPKRAIAKIGWRTEGRGDVDRQTVQELELDPNRFTVGAAAAIPIEFQLPFNAPISYDGSLLRIIWELKVNVDFPGLFLGDERQKVSFRVLPRRSQS